MKILVLGDIMGKPGRKAVAHFLPRLKKEHAPDLIIANGENLAHGKGVTTPTLTEIYGAGVDVLTGGNHIFEAHGNMLLDDPVYRGKLLRPANYPATVPGQGTAKLTLGSTEVVVLSLLCRVYMKGAEDVEDPFLTFDRIRAAYPAAIMVVDLHGEVSSERNAFGWYVDGRAAAVWGTHTHVPTADERILPAGTAFQTDVGMTGFADGVIGVEKEGPIQGFLTGLTPKKEIPEGGNVVLNALLLTIDDASGKATHVERIQHYTHVS